MGWVGLAHCACTGGWSTEERRTGGQAQQRGISGWQIGEYRPDTVVSMTL
jgi:hypothetical protein